MSTPIITSEGTTLNISGSYKAFNFNFPTIEFACGTSEGFDELDVNDDNKSFTTTLRPDAPIGDYVLQLIANNTIYSNEIHFTVGPFAISDGSNWAGRTSGTMRMTLNNDMTATISGNNNYAAENLVIPEYVFANGKFYKVTSIGRAAFEVSLLTGSLTIPNSVTYIGDSAFASCRGLTGSLTIPNSVTSIGMGAFVNCSGLTGGLTIGRNVNNIGTGAFSGCIKFTNITLVGYFSDPSWSIGSDIFSGWNNDSSSTVSSNGSLSAADALAYLKSIGLPSNWTAK